MFETYIINLQNDIYKFYELKKEFNLRGIYPKRFNAIYGKNIKDFNVYNKYLSPLCKTFGPRGLIGCGLSHYILLEKIYSNHKISNHKISNYSLILEDDVIPLFNSKNDIDKIIKKIPDDCDILSLFCQGLCKYNTKNEFIIGSRFMGSTAAYLVKHTSIPKIIKHKLIFHIDIQRYNTKDIKTYVYNPKLFNVDNLQSYNMIINNNSYFNNSYFNNYISKKLNIENISLYELLNFKVLRIPLINCELTWMYIIKIIISIIILLLLIKKL